MAVTQYRPSTDLFSLFDQMFGPTGSARQGGLLRAPEADVVETENQIRGTLEMPGMRSEDISLDLENNVLTISGQKREERTEGDEKHTWHLAERRYGQFSRSFVLPRDVDSESIQANFENGVLTVSIPKSEKARRRRIEIGGGGGASGQLGGESGNP